jgi:hypothetical protein
MASGHNGMKLTVQTSILLYNSDVSHFTSMRVSQVLNANKKEEINHLWVKKINYGLHIEEQICNK